MNWLFFLDQSTVIVLIITGLALATALAGELFWPRRATQSSLSWRWSNNLSLALVTWYISHLCNFALMLALASWTDIHQFGLFRQYNDLFWLPLVTLITITQFFSYAIHVVYHHVRWLWPLHAVHHSDTDVDISTSYRHHPFEPLIFMPLTAPTILLLGIPADAVFTYQVIHIFLTIFSHANLRLPPALDRLLSKVLVTPDFHRVHHSSQETFSNSNYGSIVPWFDYLFGTAKQRDFDEHETFELGLEYNRGQADSRLDRLLLSPLQRATRNN